MRRLLITASVLFLSLIVAGTAGAVIPEGFSEVVIFATNSVRLNSDVGVTSGDVVANTASPGPTLGNNVELYIDKKTTVTGNLQANRIKIFNQAVINGNVSFNLLDNAGTINGTQTDSLTLPVFSPLPVFQEASPGAGDISVAASGSESIAAGAYNNITAGDGSTITFTGGEYDIRSIDVQDDVTLLFSAPSVVRIAEKFRTRRRATIGPAVGSGIAASDIVFYVAGINGTDGALNSLPQAARIGSDSTVDANFYVPNGTFRAEVNTIATGAFLGRDVRMDRGAQIILNTFFVNQPPVAQDDSISTDEDTSVVVNVLDNDSDPNLDTLTVALVNPPSNGTATTDGTTITYTPAQDFNGSDSFTYEVCDDGVEPGPLCDTATVTITVNAVNDLPVAADDTATTDEDTPVVVNVLANDSDVDGNLVPATVTVTTGPGSGTTSVNSGAGAITYTPSANTNGVDSFDYQVCDDGTPLPDACDTATVTITVNPVNDTPVAVGQQITTAEDTPVVITLTGDDGDPEVTQSLTFAVAASPANGTLELNAATGVATYRPNSAGADSFSFTVTDDNTAGGAALTSLPATVPITVIPVNDPPVAISQNLFIGDNTLVTIILTGSDPDGDALTFTIVSDPLIGTLSNLTQMPPTNATVHYSLAAPLGETQQDSFTFQVDDNNGGTATAVVSIAKQGDPDPGEEEPPLAEIVAEGRSPDDPVDVVQNIPAEILLTANAPDTVGDLTFKITVGPSSGTLDPPVLPTPQVPSEGGPVRSAVVTYTPNTDFIGTDSFTFEACDTLPAPEVCDTASVAINVDVPMPVVSDQTVVTEGRTPVSINLAIVQANCTLTLKVAHNVTADASGTTLFMSAAVDATSPGAGGLRRIHMEWEFANPVPPFGGPTCDFGTERVESATLTLSTHRGSIDKLDTAFFVVTDTSADGVLDPASDFGAAVVPLPVRAMFVQNVPTGTNGVFAIDVTSELQTAIDGGFTHFAIQGRVDETLRGTTTAEDCDPNPAPCIQRGLEVYSDTSTDSSNPPPTLNVSTAVGGVEFQITTLPLAGTLRDAFGKAITTGTFHSPNVTYGSTAGLADDSFVFQRVQRDEFGEIVNTASATVTIIVNPEACAEVGRDSNCAPGQ